MCRFREDSERRVKQRKKQLEKEDEERRKQSVRKIKQGVNFFLKILVMKVLFARIIS